MQMAPQVNDLRFEQLSGTHLIYVSLSAWFSSFSPQDTQNNALECLKMWKTRFAHSSQQGITFYEVRKQIIEYKTEKCKNYWTTNKQINKQKTQGRIGDLLK